MRTIFGRKAWSGTHWTVHCLAVQSTFQNSFITLLLHLFSPSSCYVLDECCCYYYNCWFLDDNVGASKIFPLLLLLLGHPWEEEAAAVLSSRTRTENACVGCQNSRLLPASARSLFSQMLSSRGQWAPNIFLLHILSILFATTHTWVCNCAMSAALILAQ